MSCCFWWNFPSLKCWVYSHVSVLSRNQRQAWPAIAMCRSHLNEHHFPPNRDHHQPNLRYYCLLQLQLQIRLLINPINHALWVFCPPNKSCNSVTRDFQLNFWWELSRWALARFPRLWWATILPPFTTGASRLEPLWVRHVSDGRRQGISRYAQKDKYIIQMMVYSDILCCTGWLMFGANCVWEM